MLKREEFIAKMRHAVWVAYQMGAVQEYNEQPNDDQLNSLFDGIKFADENPECTPEQNHDDWMEMKVKQGWVYGEEKDFEKKTHPDLVPFDELPVVEQNKDIMDNFGHRKAVELWDNMNNVIEVKDRMTALLKDGTILFFKDRDEYVKFINSPRTNDTVILLATSTDILSDFKDYGQEIESLKKKFQTLM